LHFFKVSTNPIQLELKMLENLRANTLGENAAEHDHAKLELNFVETPEYRSLLESRDRCVVIGRRGTGKSAMAWKLQKFWGAQKAVNIILIAPEDYQTIGFRSLFQAFSGKYNLIRAASKIVWKYSLCMEVLAHLSKSFKTKETINKFPTASDHIKKWSRDDAIPFLAKVNSRFGPILRSGKNGEELISSLPTDLQLYQIEREFDEIIKSSNIRFYVIIDRLDEGFENDEIGAAIIAGAIGSISEINKHYEGIRPVLFIRDNVNKALAKIDPDYTRNIEGEILRIHWDQYQLLNLVSRRLNSYFQIGLENDLKIWDRCTANEATGRELQGKDGFRKCLQFTLYRPRDLLSLLNEAFYQAGREGRSTIILKDIEITAKKISETRLEDLKKEYESIFPSIEKSVLCFADGAPEMTVAEALSKLDPLSDSSSWGGNALGQQDYQILHSEGVLRTLYGIGFFGIHDSASDTFIFCHDGRSPDKELKSKDLILIHPCYWIGLNLTRDALTADQAEHINDEYEIKVTSQTPEIRASRIGSIIANLGTIPEGAEGAEDFELWVENAVRTVFAGHLDNVERKPNGQATQRRDVVATNLAHTKIFERIIRDYGSRQIIFEVKNYKDLGSDEFRQMLSYLIDAYGNLGFIVCRDDDENLHAGRELDWVRELYKTHKKLIIKLTPGIFVKLLGKLRSPEKHDTVEKTFNAILDKYERNYLSQQSSSSKTKRKKG
jgi:hypothetical protein